MSRTHKRLKVNVPLSHEDVTETGDITGQQKWSSSQSHTLDVDCMKNSFKPSDSRLHGNLQEMRFSLINQHLVVAVDEVQSLRTAP